MVRESLTSPHALLKSDSELLKLRNLTTIDLVKYSKLMAFSSIVRLIRHSPQAQFLKLNLMRCSSLWHKGMLHMVHMPSLVHLDLMNVEIGGGGEELLRFLSSLPNLRRFRFVQRRARSSLLGDWQPETRGNISLPSLKDIDISDARLRSEVLRYCRPEVMRNVMIDHITTRSLTSVIGDNESLKELHVCFVHHIDSQKEHLVDDLRSVPTSVQRLAIYMPIYALSSTRHLFLEDDDPSKDLLKALDHLTNLKRLVLPWTSILSRADAETDDDEVVGEATRIACRLNNPKLDYVFFQGDTIDDYSGTPKWQATFGAYDDPGKRYAVTVTRSPIVRRTKKEKTRCIMNSWGGCACDNEDHDNFGVSTRVNDEGIAIRADILDAPRSAL